MKAGNSTTLGFTSPYWSSSTLLNANLSNLYASDDAKLQPWMDVPANKIKIQFVSYFPYGLGDAYTSGDPVIIDMTSVNPPRGKGSMYQVMNYPGYVPTYSDVLGWRPAVYGGAGVQAGFRREGINVAINTSATGFYVDTTCYMRLGIIMNEQVGRGFGTHVHTRHTKVA